MSANIIEWVLILRPLHAHQAAETILSDIVAHPGADPASRRWKALTAGAMLAKAENT
jgi:hypothetical protein